MRRKVKLPQRGITLFELLTVLGLITLIVLIAAPEMYRWYQDYRVQTAVSEVKVHLLFARNAAVKRKLRYKVLFSTATNPDTYRLEFESNPGSNSWGPAPGYTDTFKMPDGVTLSADDEVIFDSRGAADAPMTLQIEIQSTGTSHQIQVFPTGAITSTKL